MISVATNGKCYPCHCFTDVKEYCEGDIFSKAIPLFEDIDANFVEPCKTCNLKYFCKAKCIADGYFASGSPYVVNMNKCRTEHQIMGASAYILYELQKHEKEFSTFQKLIKRVMKQYDNS